MELSQEEVEKLAALRHQLKTLDEKRIDVVELEVMVKGLQNSTRDITLSRMQSAVDLLSDARERLTKLENGFEGEYGIVNARDEVVYNLDNDSKMEIIDEHAAALTEFKDANEMHGDAANKYKDLVVVAQVQSHQEDRMKMATMRMDICENMFGNSANLAQERRDIANSTSLIPSIEMSEQLAPQAPQSPSLGR